MRAVAIAPFIIRWGTRRAARTCCGGLPAAPSVAREA
jgi:hypothetical protein